MKIKVTMKDPDTLHDCIREAVDAELSTTGISDHDEREALADIRVEKVQKLANKWFEYGEYLSVEIDTEAETCTVIPR